MPRFLFIAAIACALLYPAQVKAHAKLERVSPPVGSVMAASPPEIRFTFSEKLEPRFSKARVVSGAGSAVGATVSVDKKRANDLVVNLPALPAGKYRVIWRVISVDTHKTEGDYSFEIKP